MWVMHEQDEHTFEVRLHQQHAAAQREALADREQATRETAIARERLRAMGQECYNFQQGA